MARYRRYAETLRPLCHQQVADQRSEEHTSELQSRSDLVCRLLLEKKKKTHVFQTKLWVELFEQSNDVFIGGRIIFDYFSTVALYRFSNAACLEVIMAEHMSAQTMN